MEDKEKEDLKNEIEIEETPNEAVDDGGDDSVGDFLDDFFPPEKEKAAEAEGPKVEELKGETAEEVIETPVSEEPLPEESSLEGGEIEELRNQNKALLEHVEKLSGQLIGGTIPPVQTQQKAPDQPKQQAPAVPPTNVAEVPNFLDGVTVDDLLEDPNKLNMVLGRVYQTAQERAIDIASQRILSSMPELVVGYVSRHTAMNRMVDEFYKENPDLANVKQTVAAVANSIHAENSDWGVDQVFKETADRTRKLLGLKKQAQGTINPSPKKPAFAKQRGARREEPRIEGLQKEINDLLVEI